MDLRSKLKFLGVMGLFATAGALSVPSAQAGCSTSIMVIERDWWPDCEVNFTICDGGGGRAPFYEKEESWGCSLI
jgi:hypothetical protein